MQEFLQNNYRTILELIVVVVILWLGYLVVDTIFYHIKLVKDEKMREEKIENEHLKKRGIYAVNKNERRQMLINTLHFSDHNLEKQLDLFKELHPNFTVDELCNAYEEINALNSRIEVALNEKIEWERILFYENRIKSFKHKPNYQSRKRRLSYGINRNYQRHL